MKKILLLISVFVSALAITSCQDKLNEEIKAVKAEVERLENEMASLNKDYADLSSLVAAIEKNDHIKKVEQLSDGSYRITFTSNNSITLRDGADGVMPILGAKLDPETGYYYWTIQKGTSGTVNWLYDATGLRVRASAITPKLKVESGYWFLSYDEVTWLKQYESVGEAGKALFKKIDTSYEDFVTFTLANGTMFTIPTEQFHENLTEMCNKVSSSLEGYKEMITSLDSNIFVQSITKVEKEGVLEGYDVVLESGKHLWIRNGKDNDKKIYMSIQFSVDEWKLFWAVRDSSSAEPSFIYVDGKMLPAEPEDIAPRLGVKDSGGVYYFTVDRGDGRMSFMRDSSGKAVRANAVQFFDNVKYSSDGSITLSLIDFTARDGVGRTVKVFESESWTPVFYLTESSAVRDTVLADSLYTFKAVVDSIPASVTTFDSNRYSVNAIAVDSSYVTRVTKSGGLKTSGTKKKQEFEVEFRTSAVLEEGRKTKIAVFLTWDNHSIMKVMEYYNGKEDAPEVPEE